MIWKSCPISYDLRIDTPSESLRYCTTILQANWIHTSENGAVENEAIGVPIGSLSDRTVSALVRRVFPTEAND